MPRKPLLVPPLFLLLLAFAATAFAQQMPVVYPAKNQSAQQQSKDESECAAWAKQNTGIDPAQQQAPAATQERQGERLRGAARGAVGGAIIGEIAGDEAGKGAGIGAVAGGMAGGRNERARRQDVDQQAQQQHATTMDTYYRAYGACLSGRGYSVQ